VKFAKFANLICESVGGHNFLFYQIFKDDNLIWQTPGDAQKKVRPKQKKCKKNATIVSSRGINPLSFFQPTSAHGPPLRFLLDFRY
jgi:hypothetical protein